MKRSWEKTMITQETLNDMDEYINKLKKVRKENPELAKEMAVQSLIESGVFNEDGTQKENIVDGR